MFQDICIVPIGAEYPTDIGLIAENLLYYQNVNILAVPDTVSTILMHCEVEALVELLSQRNLRILYRSNYLALANFGQHQKENIVDPTLIRSPNLTIEEMIFRDVFKSTERRGYSKRAAQKILPYVKQVNYAEEIPELIRNDIANQDYFKAALINTVKYYDPKYEIHPEEIEYKFTKVEKGYRFESNIDFNKINDSFAKNGIKHNLAPSGILLNLIETRGIMHMMAELGTEISTSELRTRLMKIKFHELIDKSNKSSKNIYEFNDFTLQNGHAIREVLNKGEREFTDYIKILEKADKFRKWLNEIEDDKSIIKEYHNAVASGTWIDKLPSKAIRWSFFTGLGILTDAVITGGISTLIGMGLSLGDAFIIDKIAKGWKPNIFIEREMRNFVEDKD